MEERSIKTEDDGSSDKLLATEGKTEPDQNLTRTFRAYLMLI